MINIKNEEALFLLLLENTRNKDLDDITKQLVPFDIDWDKFGQFYLNYKKTTEKDLCDCCFQQLARVYSSQKIQLSSNLKIVFQNSNIRNCLHGCTWKEILGY